MDISGWCRVKLSQREIDKKNWVILLIYELLESDKAKEEVMSNIAKPCPWIKKLIDSAGV